MKREKYLFVGPPDNKVMVDFANLCSVILTIKEGNPSTIRVEVRGCDDRVSILIDEEVELPEADTRE